VLGRRDSSSDVYNDMYNALRVYSTALYNVYILLNKRDSSDTSSDNEYNNLERWCVHILLAYFIRIA
jgi:hypothetical protein